MATTTKSLTVEQAYLAMVRFVEGYWERRGRKGDELTLFLSYASPQWRPTADNPIETGDPAAWNDWLAAISSTGEGKGDGPKRTPGGIGS